MSGFIKRHCYQYTCVFVDHNYDFKYVHILKSQTVDESVKAKEAFEAYSETHGVNIKHYHTDNRIFIIAQFMKYCKDMHQGLTFSGVNNYHQKGRSDWCIRS